jgi:molybdopterin/thiamine biosynthesis adenylyltransferase
MGLRVAAPEGRFHRQELITWWDQAVLRAARVLVVGAGALGNEILKNLALLGVGRIFVADLDTIELSNLSRTVLFRERDLGRSKAEVAAHAVREIYPDVAVRPFVGDIVSGLGLGVFRWADLVLAGLDNREARLEVNRCCWKAGTPWVDGAIEGLDGVMRMFVPPDGPCYECTMGATDWKLLEARRSCALLTRDEMQAGKVPTTSTVAAIIAGLQCHEAVKWLHGRAEFGGLGVVFHGATNEFAPVAYQRKEECYSHETQGEPIALGAGVADVRLGDLLDRADARLGPGAVLELNRDVVRALTCPRCGDEEVWAALGTVGERRARCAACGQMRIPHFFNQIDRGSGLLDRTAAAIGVPPFDILTARRGQAEAHFLFDGDARAVLGDLAHDG